MLLSRSAMTCNQLIKWDDADAVSLGVATVDSGQTFEQNREESGTKLGVVGQTKH